MKNSCKVISLGSIKTYLVRSLNTLLKRLKQVSVFKLQHAKYGVTRLALKAYNLTVD